MKAALVLATAAGLVAAQGTTIPPCAAACIAQYLPQVGCSVSDQACACDPAKQAELTPLITPCMTTNCTPAEIGQALSASQAICSAQGGSASGSASSGSASSTKASSTAASSSKASSGAATASATVTSTPFTNSTTTTRAGGSGGSGATATQSATTSATTGATAGAAAGPVAGFAALVFAAIAAL